jgi:hypothetical protein
MRTSYFKDVLAKNLLRNPCLHTSSKGNTVIGVKIALSSPEGSFITGMALCFPECE